MKVETVKRLDELFAEHPVMRALEAPPEVELVEAERRMGSKFPPDYREFVQKYGGGMVGAYPIFGFRPVSLMASDHWSVLDVTEGWRASLQEVSDWIVFSEDHAGNPIGIDNKGHVSIYDHDFGGVSLLAADFEEYIRTHCLKMER